jgi:hypothetical protein
LDERKKTDVRIRLHQPPLEEVVVVLVVRLRRVVGNTDGQRNLLTHGNTATGNNAEIVFGAAAFFVMLVVEAAVNDHPSSFFAAVDGVESGLKTAPISVPLQIDVHQIADQQVLLL